MKKTVSCPFIIFLGIIAVVGFLAGSSIPNKSLDGFLLVAKASAAEIDPMFTCPCCGNPLDKKNICCGQAQERLDYIDFLITQNLSKENIISEYVKKYGVDSFGDPIQKEEFQKKLEKTAPTDRPIISLEKNYLDLGDVSQEKGVVKVFFEIKNTGKTDLIINKLDTSCGCTSAAVVFVGVEGPRFSMDMPMPGQAPNPTDWSVTIPAGQSAQLKVYYDPNMHKDLRGPVTREISIYSNDPVNPKSHIQIDLNQVD